MVILMPPVVEMRSIGLIGAKTSATAVAGGRSVDTSMGMTPLEGLVMGTRSGDVDPAVVAHLHRVAGLGPEEVDRALNSSSGMLALASQIALTHHEKYDGSGYPDQLVGEQIPIAAQVVGLADAYETLTTGSGSQPPVPCAAAVQMLCTGEAGAFNPVLLDCLREIENEIDDAMRRRPETL